MYKIFESKYDKRIKTVYNQGQVRAVYVEALEVCRYLSELHELKGENAKLFSEGVLGALLISSTLKTEEIMNLHVKSKSKSMQVTVDIDSDASLRGLLGIQSIIQEEFMEIPMDQGPWGVGVISVLKAKKDSSSTPYMGTVEMITGHLAKDLTYYFAQSEQIPSAIGFLVEQDPRTFELKSVRGFLIQMMPGASEDDIAKVERAVENREALMEHLRGDDCNPTLLFAQLYHDESFMILEDKNISVFCKCSEEKVKTSLMLLGQDEIKKMILEKKPIELVCDFCEKKYNFTAEQLEVLFADNS